MAAGVFVNGLARARRGGSGLFDLDVVVMYSGLAMPHGQEIDEEGDEYADEGVEDAVHGETGNAGIGAMRDGDGQEGDAGDVGQCAFAHEIGKKNQRRDGKQFARVVFSQDGGKRVFLDGLGDIHQRDDAQRNQKVLQGWQTENTESTDDEKRGHAGETAYQGADGSVQTDPEGVFDFRLQADDRGDAGVKRNPRADVAEFVNQTADEDGQCCLDDQFSHTMNVFGSVCHAVPESKCNSE